MGKPVNFPKNKLVRSIEMAVYRLLPETPPRLIVSAAGTVDSVKWRQGELRPRVYVDYPKDGIQEFDFVAIPPDFAVVGQPCPIFSEVTIEFENWMRGFRIHSATNQYEVLF